LPGRGGRPRAVVGGWAEGEVGHGVGHTEAPWTGVLRCSTRLGRGSAMALRRLARQDCPMLAGRRNVRITHPDKALFPDGTTKADLAEYYRDVAPVMLPHVRDRPISMQRFNGGIERPGFFQKDIPKGAPEWVPTVRVPKKGGTVEHVLANETATLVWLANQNCITPHVFTARADRLDRPDRIIWDLDPSGA